MTDVRALLVLAETGVDAALAESGEYAETLRRLLPREGLIELFLLELGLSMAEIAIAMAERKSGVTVQ